MPDLELSRKIRYDLSFLTLLNHFMKKLLYAAILAVALTSCTTIATHFPGVYAIDIQQGNIINQEMVDQLRPNMTKRQVLYVMGTPMLVDVFHKQRWDYIYSDQPGGDDRVQKRITLFFNGDELANIQGDFRPSSQPVVQVSKEQTVEVPPIDRSKTVFEIISGWFDWSDD